MADKPADVRFYVDADTLGLARILSSLRSDVTFPGDPGGTLHKRFRPPCPITTTGTPDTEWIGIVAEHGWLVLTRDKAISRRPREAELVHEHNARHIAIASNELLNNWHILEIVMCQWRWIESMLEVPGPFIYSITRTARTKVL
jgi:hypothetical protein